MLTSCIATLVFKSNSIKYYGVGFLIGSVAFCAVSLLLLRRYLKKLMFHVLCNQPLVREEKSGYLTKLGNRLMKRYEKKYEMARMENEDEENERE